MDKTKYPEAENISNWKNLDFIDLLKNSILATMTEVLHFPSFETTVRSFVGKIDPINATNILTNIEYS